jgi:Papain-like cysteine protease AvrRpt2
MRTFTLGLCIFFCGLTSCSLPANKEEARNQVIAQGILSPGPRPGTLIFGPALLSQGHVAISRKACEGSIGSILPPLAFTQCVANVIGQPFMLIDRIKAAVNGIQDPYAQQRHHVYLTGIEKYFVQQSKEYDCWAATLEMARRYLHLYYVSQDDLLESGQKACPGLSAQKGAEAYQIVYVIISKLYRYDQSRTTPAICFNVQCIVDYLARGHPIIMLGSGHAVLLVGMDYMTIPNQNGSQPIIFVERMFVLDPIGNGQVETWSDFTLCKEDVFMVY